MSNVSLMPVPAEQGGATCANCGAGLVTDQRYCLDCGQPCSPVRLAFLDVLQAEQTPAGLGQTIEMSPAGWVSVDGQRGASGWLRRNSGLLGLFSVLLMCLLVGLLVGHWVTQGNAPGKQVVELKGFPSAASGPTAAGASTAPASTAPAASAKSNSTAKAEAEETKAAAKETKAEKAPPPKPVTVAPAKLQKLSTSTGKKHAEEANALGNQPIETG